MIRKLTQRLRSCGYRVLLGFPFLVLQSANFSYGQDIVDVLSKNCYVCHGPSVKNPMGGLSMANLDSLKKGGKRGPALVPWKAGESLLYQAVARAGELKMPPSGSLSTNDLEIVRKWIDAGAVWPNATRPQPNVRATSSARERMR